MIIFEVIEDKMYCLFNNTELNIKIGKTISTQETKSLPPASHDIVFLPPASYLKEDAVLVCTEGFKEEASKTLPSNLQLITTPDKSADGIDESEINKILRSIFTLKPAKIFISLPNSHSCPNIEKNLKNVIKGANFSVTISADLLSPQVCIKNE